MEMMHGAPALADVKRVSLLQRLRDEALAARDRIAKGSALRELGGDGR
jgi:hypothetical protein